MKKILYIMVIIVTAVVLVGCGKKEEKITLIGTWSYNNLYTYVFNEDGTGDYSGMKFTYTTDGDKLSILYEGNTVPFETIYRIEDNKLIIKDSFDEDVIYERK